MTSSRKVLKQLKSAHSFSEHHYQADVVQRLLAQLLKLTNRKGAHHFDDDAWHLFRSTPNFVAGNTLIEVAIDKKEAKSLARLTPV